MALIKQKSFPNGISASYWRISSINIDLVSMKATIALDLFKDSQTSIPLGLQGSKKIYRFDIDPQTVMTNTLATAYVRIKQYASTIIKPEIQAVEAQEAVLDEEGNVITPAVSAVEYRAPKYADPDLYDAVDG